MATCSAADLIEESKCFLCLTERQLDAVIVRQLMIWAGSTATPQELVDSAECFLCLPTRQLHLAQAQLLCEIAVGGGGGSCECVTPTLTSLELTSLGPPFTVMIEWTLPENSCGADTINIFRSLNGGAYSLWAEVSADLTSYENDPGDPAGNEGDTLSIKLQYASNDLIEECDFSNSLSVVLASA